MNDDDIDSMMDDAGWAHWHATITTNIAKFGQQLIGVFDTQPGFTYTIGLDHKHGFELIVFGLPYQIAGFILNDIAAKLAAGETLELDKPDDRWANLPCLFKEADDRARGYVCQADRYFDKPVRTIQLVLPDRNGKFPGEEGFDEEHMGPRQVLLYNP